MTDKLKGVLAHIETAYKDKIQRGARNYLEVSIGRQASALGYADLGERYGKTFAVVPLRAPQKGMKVRIDGRTFVNYAEYDSGIVVPGFLAREVGQPYRTFVPQDSMICNYT